MNDSCLAGLIERATQPTVMTSALATAMRRLETSTADYMRPLPGVKGPGPMFRDRVARSGNDVSSFKRLWQQLPCSRKHPIKEERGTGRSELRPAGNTEQLSPWQPRGLAERVSGQQPFRDAVPAIVRTHAGAAALKFPTMSESLPLCETQRCTPTPCFRQWPPPERPGDCPPHRETAD